MPPWLAIIDCDVARLVHIYPRPAGALSVTLEPGQKEVAPVAVMAAEGFGLTVTAVTVDAALQLVLVLVTVTE